MTPDAISRTLDLVMSRLLELEPGPDQWIRTADEQAEAEAEALEAAEAWLVGALRDTYR